MEVLILKVVMVVLGILLLLSSLLCLDHRCHHHEISSACITLRP